MKSKIRLTGKNAALALVLLFIFTGCTKEIAFLNSAVVPAAEGTVSIKQDKNKNYEIDLNVMRLAEPDRLTPPKNVYVVWMETSHSGVQNIGQLKTSSKGFSKNLTSSLKTVTPHKPVSFLITAEDDATGNYPGMTVVLKTGPISDK
jgi:hypothetical protein